MIRDRTVLALLERRVTSFSAPRPFTPRRPTRFLRGYALDCDRIWLALRMTDEREKTAD